MRKLLLLLKLIKDLRLDSRDNHIFISLYGITLTLNEEGHVALVSPSPISIKGKYLYLNCDNVNDSSESVTDNNKEVGHVLQEHYDVVPS